MIQKIKKPLSVLLALMMVVSLFAIVPISAGATTYGSGDVDASSLQVGDIITGSVEYVDGYDDYTIVIKGGTYADNNDEIGTNDLTGSDSSLSFTFEDGKITISDMNTWKLYHFVDQNGNETNQMIVLAIEGEPDTEDCTITFGGFDPNEAAAVGEFVPESEYLTFTAVEAGASVTLKVASGSNLQYSLDGGELIPYTPGTPIGLVKGDSVSFRGKNTTFNGSNHVSIDGKVACSGNVMSLRLDDNSKSQGLSDSCFAYMFRGCAGLTAAPELSETMLAESCYENMFYACTNLTVAPELPATMLAPYCYSGMFAGCTSLTKAPELPATTLAESCYARMFYRCMKLTTAPELPATTLESYCYNAMFAGCSSIKLSETQTDEYSIPYSVPSGGDGTTASNALSNMFVGTGGTFKGTPEINKTYYRPAVKYTVTWKNEDGTTIDTTSVYEGTTPTYDGETPEKASDKYYDYTFSGWSDDSNTYAADALPVVSGDVTYTAQFTSEARTFMVFVKKLTGGTINVYDVSCETTVAQLKDILASQTGAPASAQRLIFAGKELEDAKTLAEYNVEKESTFHLIIRGYTVTWKNGDDVLETDTGVAKDSTPSYDGETPYKADGADCIYTFSGWNDGTTTYAPNELPAVSGNVTYTATFTESEKPETIKDCTNKYGDFRLYSNVPIVSFSNVNDLLTGAIIPITYGDSNTMIPVQDAKGYSYKFYDQTGTEIPAQITDSRSAPGSNYELSDDVTVYTNVINFTRPAGCTAIYIVATEPTPAPAPAKLILNVGENGKVVMDNGTFGNATAASNITGISTPIDVVDGANALIIDGHSVNIVEGGSINIAAGGEVSFYPSADNTGKITAIPNEGYICTGWYNGDTRYTTKDTIDYQNISEDMTLTAKFAPKLFPQHSVTLGGDIGVNFYIDSAAADFANASTAVVKFTWDNGNYNEEVNLKELTPDGDGYYKATVDVVAAQMAHKIHAEVYLNGKKLEQTDDYSVQDYAEEVYNNPDAYDKKGKPRELQALAKALLNYGAMAQIVFDGYLVEHPAPDDTVKTVGKTNFNDITADDIPGGATDLKAFAEQLGFKYYTSSVLYLSKNTLRLYFTPNTYQGAMPHVDDFKDNQSEYYYYVEKENIPAAKLDEQQSFTIGGKNFTFSALDYAKAVVNSGMGGDQKDLAKSLYLYNKAANEYFDAAPAPVHVHTPGTAVQENVVPATCSAAGSYDEVVYCSECNEELSREAKTIDMLAHTIVAVAEVPATTEADGVAAHYECSVCHKLFSDAEGNNETTAEALVIPQIVEKVVDLSTLTKGYEAQDGDVLINALKGQKYIRIADGATIKLRNANITSLLNSSGVKIAGLTLLGDATIILEGTNTIRGGYEYCPGIHVPEGKTLTIDGTGSLDVSSNGRGFGCGIGSNDGTNCGNIVINGGNITAYAGTAAGIGAKSGSSCGNITINGGTVNATSGDYGAGIGSTLYGNSICGDITINGGIVNATAKYQGAGIGSGVSANCGNITITGGIVTAIGGVNGAGIGSGEKVSICGNILITGGTVTAKGGENAAGIGSGYTNSSCGTITIADTVTQVTATKGTDAPNSIGAGSNGSTCGTVTIEDGANVTQN